MKTIIKIFLVAIIFINGSSFVNAASKRISTRVHELETQLDSYKQKQQEMQQQLIELNKLQKEHNLMLEEISTFDERIINNSKQLSAFNSAISETKANMQSNSKALSRLKKELGRLKIQLDVTAKGVQDNKEQNRALKEELNNTKLTLNQNMGLSTSNEKNISKLQSDVERINAQFITKTASLGEQLSNRASTVDNLIYTRTIYLLSAIIFIILLISYLKYRHTTDNKSLSGEIVKARESLDTEYNKLDLKLSEILEQQLVLVAANDSEDDKVDNRNTDHTLAIKVATEIHRMQKRIASMPDNTKGIRPLSKAIERLEENLEEQNYEIVDLLGKDYVEGMTVNQEFTVDENMSPDEKIITNVIKPQLNYNDTIIQVADVVISTGE